MTTFFNSLRNILFIDIETISGECTYADLSDKMKKAWNHKASLIDPTKSPHELYFQKAGIYAEFGKIIAIGTGFFFQNPTKDWSFKVKCFSGHQEREILLQFNQLLEQKYSGKKLIFCAHNGKEFDFPYLCRRMLINGLDIPPVLNLTGKKPWQVHHLDTLDLWKFGDRKNYTTLELLTTLFDIPGSKDNLDGSKVNEVYYFEEGGLERIAQYCSEDVLATGQLYLKLHNKQLIPKANIIRV